MSKPKSNTTIGAFVLNNEATYPWTVYVFVPAETGGKKKVKFKATFKHVPLERRQAMLDEFREYAVKRATAGDAPQSNADTDAVKEVTSFEELILREVLIGFSGVVDAAGAEVPFSDATRDALISNAWARDALVHAYHTSLIGRSDLGN